MAMVLTTGDIKVGAYQISCRKKIALCVEEGNTMYVCGYFSSKDHAEFLMRKIGEIIGQKMEDGHED